MSVNKWVSCFVLVVNEENVVLGWVVILLMNGVVGVILVVIFYFYCFCEECIMDVIECFLFIFGEIGCFFKKGVMIFVVVGGCQVEIGVLLVMVVGGLIEILGGFLCQVLVVVEIVMEYYFGFICDFIGGLVQVLCIECNVMGVIKVIIVVNLLLVINLDECLVNFDVIVKMMWDIVQDMNYKYKEIFEGGLVFNLLVVLLSC